jgi:MFS family permease
MIAAWLVIGAASLAGGSVTPVACLLGGMALIGVAETLWAPTGYAILNDLAPEHLRGRYNSLGFLTWEPSATVGPLYASGLLAARLPTVYVVVMIAVSALARLSALRLERHLTPAQNGVGPGTDGEGQLVRAGQRSEAG